EINEDDGGKWLRLVAEGDNPGRSPIDAHVEVGGRQAHDGIVVAVPNGHVERCGVDVGAKDRLLRRRRHMGHHCSRRGRDQRETDTRPAHSGSFYSLLNATVGDRRVALPAGNQAAQLTTTTMTIAVRINDVGSAGSMPYSRLSANVASHRAAVRPAMAPMPAAMAACRVTSRRTSLAVAPTARRMAISRVRRATTNATTPTTPAAETATAATPKKTTISVANDRSRTDSISRCRIVAPPRIVTPGDAALISRSAATASDTAGSSERMT